MKKIIAVVLMAFVTVALQAQFSKATLQASGLTCSMCSKAVKVALEKVPFVQEVKVNIKSQEYTIIFKESNNADFDALKKAVEDAGFSVASLKVIRIFFQQRSIKSSALLQKWNASRQEKLAIVVLKMVCIQKKEFIMLSFDQEFLSR